MKNNSFGIEIETTGLGREKTARAIANLFGSDVTHVGHPHDAWTTCMPDGRVWSVERDGSVTDPSAEIVSPVCTWEDIAMVQEVVRTVRRAGAKVDGSCGIHVHVGFTGHTARSLRTLVNLVNAKEDLLTQALGISPERRRRWCQPVNPSFLAAVNTVKPDTIDQFSKLWYGYNNDRFDEPIDISTPSITRTILNDADYSDRAATHYDDSRYHLLNLHAAFSTERSAHTIEFRAFNGTLHAGKIKAYIQLCLAINAKALASSTARPDRPETDNPAYAFRCWLLQLGLIGDEFKTARLHLLENLPGNAAWRHGDPTTRTRG